VSHKHPKPHIDYIDMGPWPGHIGFTMSERAFAKEMKRIRLDRDAPFLASGHALATTHYLMRSNELICIIAMKPWKKRKHTRECVAGIIAHEATHVVQQMRETHSYNDPLGREAEAYLVGHIVQECLQIVWKSKFSRKKFP
jgi:hypothetical protein